MMKNWIKGLVTLAAAAAVFLLTQVSIYAQPVGTALYNFSGVTIPAGQPQILELNQATAMGLLVKNPDGTPAIDASGNFQPDPAAIASYVSTLASLYSIPGVTELDQVAEVQYLINLMNSGISDYSHTPVIRTIAAPQPAVDVQAIQAAQAAQASAQAAEVPAAPVAPGSTYVDVNLTAQKLTYFVNGTPAIYTDIVTGKSSGGHSTPTGVFTIYGKSTNRTLKGPGYSAYVHYWMPFYKGYGLHDANWRSSFGGSIYQNNGSHGCVNIPSASAAELYNYVSVGTPVVIHN